MLVCMTSVVSVLVIMFCLLFSSIKLYGKLLILSTIQKPDNRQFSPIGFAAALRPPPFEGVHYKRWRTRAILWLTTMRCFDASNGKPKGELTPAEEKAFRKPILISEGLFLVFLEKTLLIHICLLLLARICGMHSRPSLGSQMLAVSCMLWSNSMTTR